MPGSAQLRDVFRVKGLVLKAFENAGCHTIADVRAGDLDDCTEQGIMKRLLGSIDELKTEHPKVSDWFRIARNAYTLVLGIQSAIVDEDANVPEPFRCNISLQWMEDAVITPSGHSYDRVHITRWIRCTPSDPMTRDPLTEDMLIPNRAIQAAIRMYRPLEERFLIDHSMIKLD